MAGLPPVATRKGRVIHALPRRGKRYDNLIDYLFAFRADSTDQYLSGSGVDDFHALEVEVFD